MYSYDILHMRVGSMGIKQNNLYTCSCNTRESIIRALNEKICEYNTIENTLFQSKQISAAGAKSLQTSSYGHVYVCGMVGWLAHPVSGHGKKSCYATAHTHIHTQHKV